jgi:hypothetical protein
MILAFEVLISVFGSARQVEAELANRVVWKLIRRTLKRAFPDDPTRRLPPRPMRRHHYLYLRNRYLSKPDTLTRLTTAHRELAAVQARELGLLDPHARGSWTHPDLTRMLYADGKVITPLFNGRFGTTRLDPVTGKRRQVRFEPDAGVHFEGGGSVAYGTKFVMVVARSAVARARIILDIAWVPSKQQEATVALDCFARLRALVPGAQGVIYDSALRGAHQQVLLRDLGFLPITRVRSSEEPRMPPRSVGRQKVIHVEDQEILIRDGSTQVLRLGAREGAIGIQEATGDGAIHGASPGEDLAASGQAGHYRWYNELALPAELGDRTIMVRLDSDAADRAQGFNRTEYVRAIPPSDPDFKALYSRRADAESINRGLEDSLYLRRAHSVGHARQALNLLGYALMVNSLAVRQHLRQACFGHFRNVANRSPSEPLPTRPPRIGQAAPEGGVQ